MWIEISDRQSLCDGVSRPPPIFANISLSCDENNPVPLGTSFSCVWNHRDLSYIRSNSTAEMLATMRSAGILSNKNPNEAPGKGYEIPAVKSTTISGIFKFL